MKSEFNKQFYLLLGAQVSALIILLIYLFTGLEDDLKNNHLVLVIVLCTSTVGLAILNVIKAAVKEIKEHINKEN